MEADQASFMKETEIVKIVYYICLFKYCLAVRQIKYALFPHNASGFESINLANLSNSHLVRNMT